MGKVYYKRAALSSFYRNSKLKFYQIFFYSIAQFCSYFSFSKCYIWQCRPLQCASMWYCLYLQDIRVQCSALHHIKLHLKYSIVECPKSTTCDETTSTTHFLVPFFVLNYYYCYLFYFLNFFSTPVNFWTVRDPPYDEKF